jgi:hypothetical protein
VEGDKEKGMLNGKISSSHRAGEPLKHLIIHLLAQIVGASGSLREIDMIRRSRGTATTSTSYY